MMRALLIAATLLAAISSLPKTAWAQDPAAHDTNPTDPVALSARCVKMKKDMAHGSRANTPDMRKMRAQCAELDRKAVATPR